jgi:osmotically-inducible protein OsmY
MLTAAKQHDEAHARSVERAAGERLANAGYSILKTVNCSFRNGTMILRGEVPSYYHKQVAQESVRNAPHVTKIVNDIEVLP